VSLPSSALRFVESKTAEAIRREDQDGPGAGKSGQKWQYTGRSQESLDGVIDVVRLSLRRWQKTFRQLYK